MDFSRIADVFDQHDVSFVSTTQQFNTTTSMGRLTLNVLLSFAQFEREVTAERIREKVAASKKKGMWMGGPVPLGYRVGERKLIVDAAGAATIKWLFNRYLDLKSLNALSAEAEAGDLYWGTPSKASTISFSRGKLRHLLTNPIYTGKVRHKDAVYDGEHQAIIEADLFGQVQALLARQAPTRRMAANIPDQHLPGGLLFDENGQSLLTAHTQTRGKRYRYYVSRTEASAEISSDRATARTQQPRWRLPTSLIEPIVERHLHALLADKSQLSRWVEVYGDASDVANVLKAAGDIADRYNALGGPAAWQLILRRIYKRILLGAEAITFEIRITKLISLLSLPAGQRDAFDATADAGDEIVSISIPMRLKRLGNETRIVLEGTTQQGGQRDMQLINALAKAHLYLQALTNGTDLNILGIAERYKVSGPDVSRLLPLAFLSPKITEAILTASNRLM